MAWLGPMLVLAAYLAGSVSFAVLVARRHGVDPRVAGSQNPGATNVGRLLGKRVGRTVLALDVLKGLAPAGMARLLLGPEDPYTAAAGLAAVVGHVLPVFHGWRGGKGVATAAGALFAVVPGAAAALALTYLVLKRITRRASVGSLSGVLVGAGATFVLAAGVWPRALAVGILTVVCVRHTDNVGRLVRGEEPES